MSLDVMNESHVAAMPALFLGHGNPMNAITHNAYSNAWRVIGATLPRPQAVLSISAHWYLSACAVTVNEQPRTIHDFGGFPQELFAVQYPAPGSPALAERVTELLASITVGHDTSWGLDHGTWSVLAHVFPQADIPVVQLSIDASQPPHFHYRLGAQLSPLRDEGVLVLGSGNLVHNLHAYAWGAHAAAPYDWALRFEERIKELILQDAAEAVVDYPRLGREALLAVPTPEHYLPLLYILGLRRPNDRVAFPVAGIDGGSVSMLGLQFG